MGADDGSFETETEGLLNGESVPPRDNNKADNDTQLMCKICWGSDEAEPLLKSCKCEGSSAFVHTSCLQDWLRVNPAASACIICKSRYILPMASRIRRKVRRIVGVSADVVFGTLGLMYILAMFARPLGFLLWFVFSLSTNDPFDSPMFLYMLKAKETWNDVELDIDSALEPRVQLPFGDFDQPSPIVDALVVRLAAADRMTCDLWLHGVKTAQDNRQYVRGSVYRYLNQTCGRHPDLHHYPAFRFCQCDVDQTEMSQRLTETIRRSMYRVDCAQPSVLHRSADGSYAYPVRQVVKRRDPMDFPVNSTLSLLKKFLYAVDYVLFVRVNPVRPFVRRLLPLAVGKYRIALTYIKYTPRTVSWLSELRNPRFYGFPFGLTDNGLSRGFVIKSLDYHFCITLVCGIVIDLFLFLRLWYTGMNPIVEALQQGFSQGSQEGMGGAQGYHAAGFGGGWLMNLFHGIKATLVEQWKTWAVLLVFQYQMLKAWWAVSLWSEILSDMLGLLVAFICCLVIYVYVMLLVSLIVLRTFEMDVLHLFSDEELGIFGF